MMKNTAGRVAFCGVMAALAIVLMSLGNLVPAATFCCPMLGSLLLIPVLDGCGKKYALCWYAAVSLLSLLLLTDREAAILFLLLGNYPILKPAIDRLPLKALRVLCRLAVFLAAALALYGLLRFFGLETIASEFPDAAGQRLAWILTGSFMAGALVFLLYDVVVSRMTRLWQKKWRKRLF